MAGNNILNQLYNSRIINKFIAKEKVEIEYFDDNDRLNYINIQEDDEICVIFKNGVKAGPMLSKFQPSQVDCLFFNLKGQRCLSFPIEDNLEKKLAFTRIILFIYQSRKFYEEDNDHNIFNDNSGSSENKSFDEESSSGDVHLGYSTEENSDVENQVIFNQNNITGDDVLLPTIPSDDNRSRSIS